MVKDEPSSSSDSSSDSDALQTPLAASTQRSPSPGGSSRSHDVDSDSDESRSEFYVYLDSLKADNESNAENSSENALENYLSEFSNVELSESKNCVDVDAAGSDDEVWIIKCPKSIKAKKTLLGATIEKFRHQAASTIKTSHAGRLEAYVVKNKIQKPVTLMAGTKFQSFVPAGTVQIRETIEMPKIKSDLLQTTLGVKDDEIPFPEDIRDRHPLLGQAYKAHLKLPKRVKKTLSLAQQRADAYYLNKNSPSAVAAETSEEQKDHVKIKTAKKRKHDDQQLLADNATGDMIQKLIKEEGQSPSPKKKKKPKTEVDDDLSWLNNM